MELSIESTCTIKVASGSTLWKATSLGEHELYCRLFKQSVCTQSIHFQQINTKTSRHFWTTFKLADLKKYVRDCRS